MAVPKSLSLDLDHLPADAVGCEACLHRLFDRLSIVNGVQGVKMERDHKRLILLLENLERKDEIAKTARRIMSEVATGYGHETLRIGGMDCPACAEEIEAGLKDKNGIYSCHVNFATRRLQVEYDKNVFTSNDLRKEIRKLGYSAHTLASKINESATFENLVLLSAFILWSVGTFLVSAKPLSLFFLISAGVIGGYRMLATGLLGISRLRFTMNALMTIAVIGAAAIGEWVEASLVCLLYAFGNRLQASAAMKTQSAVRELMESAPKTAFRMENNQFVERPIHSIQVGDILRVLPHEIIPIDGVVIEGESTVNNSTLTGESEPLPVSEGAKVLAGGINEGGGLIIKCDRPFADTTYARTIELIEKGQSARTPQQDMIDRFSNWYTPTVIIIASIIAVSLPLFGVLEWRDSLHRAFWLLMVSCPCALVISTPIASARAISAASKIGALVKGGAYLEALTNVKKWIFDKTGTLTYARLEVSHIEPLAEIDEQKILQLAGSIAEHSHHPVSRAIYKRASSQRPFPKLSNIKSTPGGGIEAWLDNDNIKLGSAQFVNSDEKSNGGTYLSINNKPVARFTISELPKNEAKQAINQLKQNGAQIAMFSGDENQAVQRLARQLEITDYFAGMTPEEKAQKVEELSTHTTTAMVGDGINDVAALQRATIPIAMGAAGSGAAIESADIVLLNDEIQTLPKLLRLSKTYKNVVAQNIAFSLITKGVLVLLGILVAGLPFSLAVAGDMGVSLMVIANSWRIHSE